MIDQYTMFEDQTSKDTHGRTSSQESACGITHLTSQDGRKIVPFGQVLAHVSRLVPQVDKLVKTTIDTYGPNGSASSASVALQQSLENRLAARLPKGGLTMFIKGWKRKATPLGRLYCQLAPSVPPIDESACGLWPTVRASSAMNESAETIVSRGGPRKARLEQDVAITALWATPAVRDYKDTGDLSKSQWRKDGKERNDTLGRQAYGSTAQTGNKGSLNPEFPCWLMGIPKEWVSSIVRGMQLYRK